MSLVTYYGCYDHNEEWYLIELALDVPASEILWEDMYVPELGVKREDQQAPYMEQYLNEDGTAKLCETYDVPKEQSPSSRVDFFLYKVSSKTLSTPYGEFPLTAGVEIPRRLDGLIDFDEP